MTAGTTRTKAVNGWRWIASRKEWPYEAYTCAAQVRCTTDSGTVYYKYVGPRAEFDTREQLLNFMQNWKPEVWAKGENPPMNVKHAQAILQALDEWFASSDNGPSSFAQLFDDELSLKEHIKLALRGIPPEL